MASHVATLPWADIERAGRQSTDKHIESARTLSIRLLYVDSNGGGFWAPDRSPVRVVSFEVIVVNLLSNRSNLPPVWRVDSVMPVGNMPPIRNPRNGRSDYKDSALAVAELIRREVSAQLPGTVKKIPGTIIWEASL